MKIIGWVLIVIGSLSVLGAIIAGNVTPIGGLFWLLFGCYLLHRAKQKEKESDEKSKWESND